MSTAVYQFSITVAGFTSSKTVTRTADHPNAYEVSIPAAFPLTSWVKTDNDTGAGNLAAGHGQTSGTYDVYWTTGQRLGMTGTVTVNALALDGGTGDNLPASADSTVRVCKQVVINTAIDGDAIKIAFIKLGYADEVAVARGRLLFKDTGAATIADLDTADGINANVTNIYDIEGGALNPFTGNPITSCAASHSNTAGACTLTIATLEDSTP